MTLDRFLVNGGLYREVRDSLARSILSGNTDELIASLEVKHLSCLLFFLASVSQSHQLTPVHVLLSNLSRLYLPLVLFTVLFVLYFVENRLLAVPLLVAVVVVFEKFSVKVLC